MGNTIDEAETPRREHNNAPVTWGVLPRLHRRLRQAVCRRLFQDRHADVRNSMLVAGTARSGTTWLADLIASQVPCRILFEPFHPLKVEAFRPYHYFQYMRPDAGDPYLLEACTQVFTGTLRNPWVDRYVEYLFPRYRLIKTIRGTLMLRWLHDRFPEVPLVLILRHPCAVVRSRLQLRWATDGDIRPFLDQPALIDDFLADKLDVIRRAATPEEKHAVIWCVSNLVPLRQFRDRAIHVFFYEHLITQPETEIPRLFQAIRQPFRDTVYDRMHRPSITTISSSAVVTGRDPVAGWQRTLSPAQVRAILSVVDAFGLGDLYGESPMPGPVPGSEFRVSG